MTERVRVPPAKESGTASPNGGRTAALNGRGHSARRLSLDVAERRRVLVFGDASAAAMTGLAAVMAWNLMSNGHVFDSLGQRAFWIPVLALTWLLTAALVGSYSVSNFYIQLRSLKPLLFASGLHLSGYLVFYFFAPRSALPRVFVLVFEAGAVLSVWCWRHLWTAVADNERWQRSLILLPYDETSRALAKYLSEHPEAGFRVLGFVSDATLGQGAHSTASPRVLGEMNELVDLVQALGASDVAIDLRSGLSVDAMDAVLACNQRGIPVTNASELLEILTGKVHVAAIANDWPTTLPLNHRGNRALYLGVKRALDVAGGALGLCVLALMALPIALAIKLNSRGPVLYRQTRTGLQGRPYVIWKFRTMSTNAEETDLAVWAAPNDSRATGVGTWLRRSHLDELPQFWNVFRGDMSLVGPRPERPEWDVSLERSVPFYRMRWSVKPGIAGWAAVNASYVDGSEKAIERLEYDLFYIKHQSLWLDAKILLRALVDVLQFGGR